MKLTRDRWRHPEFRVMQDLAIRKLMSDKRVATVFLRDMTKIPDLTIEKILDPKHIRAVRAEDNSVHFYHTDSDLIYYCNHGRVVCVKFQRAKQKYLYKRVGYYLAKNVVEIMDYIKSKHLGESVHNLYDYIELVYHITVTEAIYFPDSKRSYHYASLAYKTDNYKDVEVSLKETDKFVPRQVEITLECGKADLSFEEPEERRWIECVSNRHYTDELDEDMVYVEELLDYNTWTQEEKSMIDYEAKMQEADELSRLAAIDEGIERGIEQGIIKAMLTLLSIGAIEESLVCDQLRISLSELHRLQKKA